MARTLTPLRPARSRVVNAVTNAVTNAVANAVKTPQQKIMDAVCELLKDGVSLQEACTKVQGAKPSTVLHWGRESEIVAAQYASAREDGYLHLADKIQSLAAETHSFIQVHARDKDGLLLYEKDGTPKLTTELAPLSPDVIASKRLQVETLKWQLSKMLPKMYGDKTVTEISGVNGGPITIAALNLRGLSDVELTQMQQLMSKTVDVIEV
jgi:hypothetical protein